MTLKDLELINTCIFSLAFALTLFIEGFVFISLKFKLDRAAYLIAIAYLFVTFIRIVPSFENFIVFIILWPTASNLIWAILFYFIFEMRAMYIKLTSDSVHECMRRELSNRKKRNILLSIFFVGYMLPAVTTYYIVRGTPDIYFAHFQAIIAVIIASRVLKMLIDVYMCLEFLILFAFFVKEKIYALDQTGRVLSRFNRFVIVWAYMNFSLKTFNAFCVLTVLTVYQVERGTPDDDTAINWIYNVSMRTLVCIIDCLNMATIMYLFYFQGWQQLKRGRTPKAIKGSMTDMLAPA